MFPNSRSSSTTEVGGVFGGSQLEAQEEIAKSSARVHCERTRRKARCEGRIVGLVEAHRRSDHLRFVTLMWKNPMCKRFWRGKGGSPVPKKRRQKGQHADSGTSSGFFWRRLRSSNRQKCTIGHPCPMTGACMLFHDVQTFDFSLSQETRTTTEKTPTSSEMLTSVTDRRDDDPRTL